MSTTMEESTIVNSDWRDKTTIVVSSIASVVSGQVDEHIFNAIELPPSIPASMTPSGTTTTTSSALISDTQSSTGSDAKTLTGIIILYPPPPPTDTANGTSSTWGGMNTQNGIYTSRTLSNGAKVGICSIVIITTLAIMIVAIRVRMRLRMIMWRALTQRNPA